MTDEEKIRKEAQDAADIQHRLRALETEMAKLQNILIWAVRAVWAVAIYFATQVWEFIAAGGTMK